MATPISTKEIAALQTKYPNNIFVLVDTSSKNTLPPLDKRKYIVPKDMLVGGFLFMLRKRISLPPEKAMYFFVENVLPPTTTKMGDLYHVHGKDGYLRVTLAAESTFG
jgi:GABA(A) receptor-associated protein